MTPTWIGDTGATVNAGVTQGSERHGNVYLAGSDVTYTPGANFNGSDSFTYTDYHRHAGFNGDGNGQYRHVVAANDAPIAVDDTLASTNEDTARHGHCP